MNYHERFLLRLLEDGFGVFQTAINTRTAASLIDNFSTSVGYSAATRPIKDGLGAGLGKRVIDLHVYRLDRLMSTLYEVLRPAAILWANGLGYDVNFPRDYDTYQHRCFRFGQTNPAVVFRYLRGDYVRFHCDAVGGYTFPFQVVTMLSDEGSFTGGEFLLRRITGPRTTVLRLSLHRGDLVVFPMREQKSHLSKEHQVWQHAVAQITGGERYSLSLLLNQAPSNFTLNNDKTQRVEAPSKADF